MVMARTGTLQAGTMGFVCGSLHAFGPDHLATLVTFSACMPPLAAAQVGASWGVGHCFGVVMIGLIIWLVGLIPGLNMEGWYETSGDYIIGASMILVAIYFVVREEHYITVDSLGDQTVQSCLCCSATPSVGSSSPSHLSPHSVSWKAPSDTVPRRPFPHRTFRARPQPPRPRGRFRLRGLRGTFL
eukprot:Skav234063  [mRNA]  locus=scaffold619:236965:243903:- [translate_table: standard]